MRAAALGSSKPPVTLPRRDSHQEAQLDPEDLEEGEIPDDEEDDAAFAHDDATTSRQSEAITLLSEIFSHSIPPTQLVQMGVDPAFLAPALNYLGRPPLPSTSFTTASSTGATTSRQDWEEVERSKRDELRRRKQDALDKRNESSARDLERELQLMFQSSPPPPAIVPDSVPPPAAPSTSTSKLYPPAIPTPPVRRSPPTTSRRPLALDLISDPVPSSSHQSDSLVIDLSSSDDDGEFDDEEASDGESDAQMEGDTASSDDELEAQQVLQQLGLVTPRLPPPSAPPLLRHRVQRPTEVPSKPQSQVIPLPMSHPLPARPIRSLPPSRRPSLPPTAPPSGAADLNAKKKLTEKEEEIKRVMAKIQAMEAKRASLSSSSTASVSDPPPAQRRRLSAQVQSAPSSFAGKGKGKEKEKVMNAEEEQKTIQIIDDAKVQVDLLLKERNDLLDATTATAPSSSSPPPHTRTRREDFPSSSAAAHFTSEPMAPSTSSSSRVSQPMTASGSASSEPMALSRSTSSSNVISSEQMEVDFDAGEAEVPAEGEEGLDRGTGMEIELPPSLVLDHKGSLPVLHLLFYEIFIPSTARFRSCFTSSTRGRRTWWRNPEDDRLRGEPLFLSFLVNDQ